jgi:hypothetical protein
VENHQIKKLQNVLKVDDLEAGKSEENRRLLKCVLLHNVCDSKALKYQVRWQKSAILHKCIIVQESKECIIMPNYVT